MTKTSDLERRNLEAHVDLCAERYHALHGRIEILTQQIINIEQQVTQVATMLHTQAQRQDQRWTQMLATVLITVITALGTIAWHWITSI